MDHIGMFHNPETNDYGAQAHQYITLSRASLAVDCIFVNASVTAIDAMLLHVQYFEMSDDPGGAAKAWAALGTTLKLAQSVSRLHKDLSTTLTPLAWLAVGCLLAESNIILILSEQPRTINVGTSCRRS